MWWHMLRTATTQEVQAKDHEFETSSKKLAGSYLKNKIKKRKGWECTSSGRALAKQVQGPGSSSEDKKM
jgi:hypothetical protein